VYQHSAREASSADLAALLSSDAHVISNDDHLDVHSSQSGLLHSYTKVQNVALVAPSLSAGRATLALQMQLESINCASETYCVVHDDDKHASLLPLNPLNDGCTNL
jgi:hypothetical protein